MVKVHAHAKINLGLRICPKREDGYHDLETIFHRISLFDEITISSSASLLLNCDDPTLPADGTNLCLRAAQILQKMARVTEGAEISLVKKIPVGAGLGGGSSDAASVLLGLVEHWGLRLDEDRLIRLALQIGSDVPYFLKNGTAYARGRGEILEYFYLDLPYWVVLLYPNIQVSTAWAYASFDSSRQHHKSDTGSCDDLAASKKSSLKDFVLNQIHNPHELNKNLLNDFEPVVLHEHKNIGIAKLMLYSEGACFAQMSGSGSSVYGFFDSEDKAMSAAKKLGNRFTVFLTPRGFRAG